MSEDIIKIKGKKNGKCNRTACQSEREVVWYNHSTRKYYCKKCGIMLNRANHIDAMKLYGHELCTVED